MENRERARRMILTGQKQETKRELNIMRYIHYFFITTFISACSSHISPKNNFTYGYFGIDNQGQNCVLLNNPVTTQQNLFAVEPNNYFTATKVKIIKKINYCKISTMINFKGFAYSINQPPESHFEYSLAFIKDDRIKLKSNKVAFDINQDGKIDQTRICYEAESLYLSTWSNSPLHSKKLFGAPLYLNLDLDENAEPVCSSQER